MPAIAKAWVVAGNRRNTKFCIAFVVSEFSQTSNPQAAEFDAFCFAHAEVGNQARNISPTVRAYSPFLFLKADPIIFKSNITQITRVTQITHGIFTRCCFFLVALGLNIPAHTISPAERAAEAADTAAIAGVTFSEESLRKYMTAGSNMVTFKRADPTAWQNLRQKTSAANSVEAMAAAADAAPAAKKAITSAGLTSRLFFLMNFSIMQNTAAADAIKKGQPLPKGTSAANVDAVKNHVPEITALMKQL